MQNREPSISFSSGNSWRVYFLAILVLVASFVVMNVTGLRVREAEAGPDASTANQSIYTGDTYVRQALITANTSDRKRLAAGAVRSYRSVGSTPSALRRIIVVRESLLGESAESDIDRLAKAGGGGRSEAEIWQIIYGGGRLSSGAASRYIARINDLDLGPLKQLAASDVYASAGRTAEASAAREQAKSSALANFLPLAAMGLFMAVAGVIGLVLIWTFFTRQAPGLSGAPAPRVQPTVLFITFLVYLVAYTLLGTVTAWVVSTDYLSGSLLSSVQLGLQLVAMFASVAIAWSAFGNMTRITGEDAGEAGFRFENPARKAVWGLGAYCAALPFVGVAAYISQLLSQTVFRGIETPEHPILPRIAEGGIPLLLSFLVAVIAAPIVEEIAFRGFLYTALRGRMGVWVSAVGSGAIFAAVHPTIPNQFLPLLVLGVVLAIVREKTGSLLPSMVCHATNNAVVLLWATLIA